MDGFQRTGNSSGQFGSPEPQRNPQGSQGGALFGQGQNTQGGSSYSHGSAAQGASALSQGQGSQGYSQNQNTYSGTSYSSAQNHGQTQGQPDARQAFGGQATQHVAGGNVSDESRPPSISRRKYIKWSMVSNHGDSEDTETIVLTDPESGLFVDVRLLKAHLREVQAGDHVQLEPEQIDWAFAGETISTPLGLDKAPYHRHVKFNHWIDSRSLSPEEVVDNAYMYYPNDGTDDEIEVGSMVNPHTGDKQGYEERWIEEEVVPAGGQQQKICIVLTTEQADGTRGSVMILGQWAQGVLRTGQGTLHIERWVSNSGSGSAMSPFGAGQTNINAYPSPQPSQAGLVGETADTWQLLARVGVPILPSPASFINEQLTVDTICSVKGMQWKVRAIRRW